MEVLPALWGAVNESIISLMESLLSDLLIRPLAWLWRGWYGVNSYLLSRLTGHLDGFIQSSVRQRHSVVPYLLMLVEGIAIAYLLVR